MEGQKLKELSKLIDLCRKKGVSSIEFDGMKLTLDLNFSGPKREYRRKRQPSETQEQNQIHPEVPTDIELMFASSGGIDRDDPLYKELEKEMAQQ